MKTLILIISIVFALLAMNTLAHAVLVTPAQISAMIGE